MPLKPNPDDFRLPVVFLLDVDQDGSFAPVPILAHSAKEALGRIPWKFFDARIVGMRFASRVDCKRIGMDNRNR